MARPLTCTKCGGPVTVVEDGTAFVIWGAAVVTDDGTVQPDRPEDCEFHKGDPVRVRAVCTNDECRHQWTLRRRFDPTPAHTQTGDPTP